MNRFGNADEERGPVGVFEGYSEHLRPDADEDDPFLDDEDWQESGSHWDESDEDEDDGQPDERQEWHDFDPDC